MDALEYFITVKNICSAYGDGDDSERCYECPLRNLNCGTVDCLTSIESAEEMVNEVERVGKIRKATFCERCDYHFTGQEFSYCPMCGEKRGVE